MGESRIDKSSWPRGPWDDEPDEVRFEHNGWSCLVWRTKMGHLCGYVRVPEGHALHGMDYTCAVPMSGYEDAEVDGSDMGQMIAVLGGAQEAAETGVIRLDSAIQVHGGLTFAGELLDEKGWWLGFDCAHYRDLSPGNPSEFTSYEDVYRDVGYVSAQCRKLADQVAVVTEVCREVTPEQAREELRRKVAERKEPTDA